MTTPKTTFVIKEKDKKKPKGRDEKEEKSGEKSAERQQISKEDLSKD